jgi:cytochrome c5
MTDELSRDTIGSRLMSVLHRGTSISILTLLALYVSLPRVEAKAGGPANPMPIRLFSLIGDQGPLWAALQSNSGNSSGPPSSSSPSNRVPAKSLSDVALPEGKGKELTKRLCGKCHGTNVFAQQRHNDEKWGSIVDNMVAKGMEASDDDLAEVNEYLATYLGPPKQGVPRSAPNASPATPPQ